MLWWIGTLLGCVALAIKNYMSRTLDMTTLNVILMQIPLFGAGMFYWYGFRHAPKFINCWFLGSGLNSFFGITMGLLIFDKVLSLNTTVGIVCVLTGTYLLGK